MLYFTESFFVACAFVHLYLMFMVCMTLISDFSSVLLDTTDNLIILPRPVSSKTLFAARFLHIVVYLLSFTLALSLGAWIAVFISQGIIVGLVFILTSLLAVLLAVFFTFMIYLLILRFAGPGLVNRVILFFQVMMTVLFTLGYQFMPRLFGAVAQLDGIQQKRWIQFLPPVWFARTVDAFRTGIFSIGSLLMMMLALLVPLLLVWLTFRFLAPRFASKLDGLQGGAASGRLKRNASGRSISEKLAPVFTRNSVEAAMFIFTWKSTGREKFFQLQFLPSLVIVPVLFFVFALDFKRDFWEAVRLLPQSNSYLYLIYLPVLILPGTQTLARFHEQYAAGWVFQAAPSVRKGELVSGTDKAIFVKYFFPMFAASVMVCFWIWGMDVAVDCLLGMTSALFIGALASWLLIDRMPFSEKPSSQRQGGKFLFTLVFMLLLGVAVVAHYFLRDTTWALWMIAAMELVAAWALYRKVKASNFTSDYGGSNRSI
jgi:hypothetical protein